MKSYGDINIDITQAASAKEGKKKLPRMIPSPGRSKKHLKVVS